MVSVLGCAVELSLQRIGSAWVALMYFLVCIELEVAPVEYLFTAREVARKLVLLWVSTCAAILFQSGTGLRCPTPTETDERRTTCAIIMYGVVFPPSSHFDGVVLGIYRSLAKQWWEWLGTIQSVCSKTMSLRFAWALLNLAVLVGPLGILMGVYCWCLTAF